MLLDVEHYVISSYHLNARLDALLFVLSNIFGDVSLHKVKKEINQRRMSSRRHSRKEDDCVISFIYMYKTSRYSTSSYMHGISLCYIVVFSEVTKTQNAIGSVARATN